MAMHIEELLRGKTEQIDYAGVIRRYPWIVEEGHSCILSPDSDGFLCGLLMAKYKHWKIVGFYDDKVSVIKRSSLREDPIFLDGEIFRPGIRSVGHHMLLLNKRQKPDQFDKGFVNCIQPNLFRGYDGKHDFRLKYPLATIHLLASILAFEKKGSVKMSSRAIPPLFFTDGVFNVLFKYPENVLNWLHYLRVDEDWNPLKNVFESDKYTVFTLMKEMQEFFRRRDEIDRKAGKLEKGERGDKLRLSDGDGAPKNIDGITTGCCNLKPGAKARAIEFIGIIGEMTGWDYVQSDWDCWSDLQYFKFKKGSFKDAGKTLTGEHFLSFIKRNPLSWAQTSGANIEFTLETPSRLPFNLYKRKKK